MFHLFGISMTRRFRATSGRGQTACLLKSCFYLNEVQGLEIVFRVASIMSHIDIGPGSAGFMLLV